MKTLLALLVLTTPVLADVVVAARDLPAGKVLAADDLLTVPGSFAASFGDPNGLIGKEVRAVIKGGRPILTSQIGAPVLIERNATVSVFYYPDGIVLEAEARALDSAAAGEAIRVQNMGSRRIISGRVQDDGTILVTGSLLPQS
jgi:flagella basal body P-ring formation protein FlgA